jgi:aspartyl-tRNA(Asn)/glutamyl-tRNA(Gln) amidotransferase subunit C
MSDAGGKSGLDLDAVRRVARLARLDLSQEKLTQFHREMGAVLDYARRLQALDLSGIEPMASPLDQRGPLAPDEPGPTLPTETLLEMAPDKFDRFVKVPKVIGDGGAA